MTGLKEGFKVSIISILGNILLSIFKLIAGIIGKSNAMISDSIHSISDVLSTVVVIIGLKIASKEEDKHHPYGHERFECVAASILSIFLFITGILIGYNGVYHVFIMIIKTSKFLLYLPLIACYNIYYRKRRYVLVYKKCCQKNSFRFPYGRCLAS